MVEILKEMIGFDLRVRAPVNIIQDNEILSISEIKLKEYYFQDIIGQTDRELISWLVKHRLLYNRVSCRCGTEMSFTCRSGITDRYCWKCKGCSKRITIRSNSYFARSHLSLRQILIIMYCWSRNFPQHIIAHEAKLAKKSTHTIVDWCSLNREIYEEHIIRNPTTIGGLNEDFSSKIVEINESKFFHLKYERSEWKKGHWVFGAIERESNQCFMIEVPDRTVETLCAIIERLVQGYCIACN